MFDDDDLGGAETPDKPAWKRFGVPLLAAIGMFAVAAGAITLLKSGGSNVRPHQQEHITQVQLPPPPPPPPIKPPPPPPPEKPKEVEQQKTTVPKPTPVKIPAPPVGVTTSIAGNGPGSLGLGNDGGGDVIGNGSGDGGDTDSYYAGMIKTQIASALRGDDVLRTAKYRTRLSIRVDDNGHLIDAQIADFTGDPDIRAALARVLRSLSINETPPADITTKTFNYNITES